ncbi:MAG: restriction endonuclease subunit S [Sarcina sp.]
MTFNSKSEEWKEIVVGDIAEVLNGYAFKAKDFTTEGIPVIKIKNIVPPEVSIDDVQFVSETLYNEKLKYGLEYNDILISMTGSGINQIASAVGKLGRVKLKNQKMLLNQRVGKIFSKDTNYCDENYLYYYLSQYHIRYNLAASAGGSANQANINPAQIKAIGIKLPPLEEQKTIAKILSDLDEKIETNNKINKNLEEMAQAIFKQWFVDFEFPNEEGKPYKSSGGEMVESELGMIPKGWKVGCVNSFGSVVTGKTPSTKSEENFGEKYNFITPKDVSNEIFIINSERNLSEIGAEKVKKNIIPPKSIGVTCIGSNLGKVYINSNYAFTNQQINSLILDDWKRYPYMFIVLSNMKNEFMNIASGSAVPIINKTTFSNIKVVVPNKNELNEFGTRVGLWFDKIDNNFRENQKLEKLRDTLLPKLMSGEIRVPLNTIEN